MKTLKKYIGWTIPVAAALLTLWNDTHPRRTQLLGTKPVVAKPCPGEPPLPDYFVINGKVIPNPIKTRMGPCLTPEQRREEQTRKVLE
jgi:hypothetical protein